MTSSPRRLEGRGFLDGIVCLFLPASSPRNGEVCRGENKMPIVLVILASMREQQKIRRTRTACSYGGRPCRPKIYLQAGFYT